MNFKFDKPLTYEETVRFHGHNGPFVALGYRLGRYIVTELKPRYIDDIQIEVYCKRTTPFSCLVDGLQCSTHATLGKGNIELFDSEELVIIVKAWLGEEVCSCIVSPRALDICIESDNIEEAAKRILDSPERLLWRKQ